MVKSEEIEKVQFQLILQIYITSSSTAAVTVELGRFLVLKATKYIFCLQLPNIPHYLAEGYITVTNNELPGMRDLHSADLPIATTEPFTSDNECLQVVKPSAIAKHLTEWSDVLWKDSKYNQVETLPTAQD